MGIELYKEFIDGLVNLKNGMDAKRILGKGYPDTEEKRPYNELLAALSEEQKQTLAKLVQSAREGGIHDTLHDDFLGLIEPIRNDPSTSDEIRNAIDDFTW